MFFKNQETKLLGNFYALQAQGNKNLRIWQNHEILTNLGYLATKEIGNTAKLWRNREKTITDSDSATQN